MRVLVTGARGKVGRAAMAALQRDYLDEQGRSPVRDG